MKAIFLNLSAWMVLPFMDAIAKYLSSDLSFFQITWARYFFTVVFTTFFMFLFYREQLKFSQNIKLQIIRGLSLFFANICFFYSISVISMAKALTLAFVAPLVTTALSPFLLKEKDGYRRWTAVLVGFFGILVVIRPGYIPFESGTLWLLSAALTFSIVIIIVKKLTEKDSSLTTTFYQMAFMVPPTFLLALIFWENITINQVIIFIFVALAGFVTQFSFAQCLKMADTTFIMPIQFTKLVWLSIIGYLFFQELPDYWTWIGASIIFASILFITYREAVNKNSVLKSKKVNKLISNYQ